ALPWTMIRADLYETFRIAVRCTFQFFHENFGHAHLFLCLREQFRFRVSPFQERTLEPTEVAIRCANDQIGIAVTVPVHDGNSWTIWHRRHAKWLASGKVAVAQIVENGNIAIGSAGDDIGSAIAVPVRSVWHHADFHITDFNRWRKPRLASRPDIAIVANLAIRITDHEIQPAI